MLTPWRLFLCQMALNIFHHIAKASLCLGGQDIFAMVRENSPTGEIIAHLSINGDPGASSIRLCLTGENADWFYLEGRTIRLNSSFSRTLDREVLGSVLIAALTCYEDDIIRSRYRIMVEILNENDNMPYFLEDTIQPRYISELLTVNSMVFTVKARDGDGDTITYMTDKSTADASYFRIDLPNSGMVILDKPLDYETKTQLQVVIFAVETTTKEKYSTTATVTVNVLDGDDQYPQFQPCAPVYEDGDHNICTNPVYSVNIRETDEDAVLYFSPGPIHAEDGDKDILTPLVYSILSGDGNGRFTIDSKTGEISLRQRVENRLLTPSFRLRIMAAQVNDPKKYSVATALVHVVSENRFPPFFNKTVYKGFLIESSSPATLVTTYGNQVLGINPKIHYTMQPLMGSNKLYHITQDGIVIAKTDRLRAFDRHILEVIATDEESGETAHASVDIEVLQRGQPVPRSPFGEERLFGDMNAGMAGGIAALVLLVAVTVLFLFLWLAKRRRERRDPADRGAVALGKHPNVSLRWFQQVNSGRPISLIEDASYHNEAFIDHEYPSDLYTKTDDMLPASIRAYESERPTALQDMLPILVLPEIIPANTSSSALTNGKAFGKSVSFKDDVGAVEETLPKNEGHIVVVCNQIETRADILMPVMQQDTFATATAENPAEKFDVCCPDTSVRPREECIFAHANEDDEDDNDPYKNMASVIYSSDEDTGDDEPNDLRHYYKHGQNQFTIDHMKAIGLQIEDSDESQA
ncbi:cadherin-related family member 5 isoform X3 [Sinocyclocheilus rhinocerous]|uniref:cadherin-related family member 5 isoform X3 n=1 Tax=Sinocyclocheilus rhinocerous TaxID=307959 RepID=UPI0007BA70D4|nr:PREDICTED: cadherin-related family member 5-like isoform X3 [Sinocyclocheilus rhinocerous]